MTSPTTAPPVESDDGDNPIPCERCGQPHPRCRGHRKDGNPCTMWPRKGSAVCKRHGGNAPQVKAAAKRRQDEEKAAKAVATFGLPREISPDAALLEEVHRTAGHVAWLGELVQLADTSQLTQRGEQGIITESVWLKLYQDERAHLVSVCKAAIAAGIAERQVRLAEQQGMLLAGAVRQILERLGLTPEQQALVPQVVPAVLREISGGSQ